VCRRVGHRKKGSKSGVRTLLETASTFCKSLSGPGCPAVQARNPIYVQPFGSREVRREAGTRKIGGKVIASNAPSSCIHTIWGCGACYTVVAERSLDRVWLDQPNRLPWSLAETLSCLMVSARDASCNGPTCTAATWASTQRSAVHGRSKQVPGFPRHS
jgi:hypothetical protein